MNWDDIRFFLHVARSGTLSAAAKDLTTSQPTVGRHIDRLEKRLGARLFERTPAGLSLTSVGEQLMVQAEKINSEVISFLDHPGLNEDELSGTVRVRFGELTSLFFASCVHDFRQRYPHIKIELITSNERAQMSRREADIALVSQLPEHGDLVAKRVLRYAHAVYGTRSYVAANPAAFTEDRYQLCDWISDQGVGGCTTDYDWVRKQLGDKEPVVYCRTFTAVTAALEGGAGLAVQAAYTAERNPNLVRVSPIIEEISFNPWMIAHKSAVARPRVRAVWDWLLGQFQKHKDEFETFRSTHPDDETNTI